MVAVATASLLQVTQAPPASAFGASVSFVGHGWGHGRGMGQWGAYGYASQFGWNDNQILDHYYSNTTMMNIGSNPGIGVRLTVNETSTGFHDLIFSSASPFTVAGVSLPAGGARIRLVGNQYFVDQGASCGGPWTQVAAPGTGPVLAVPAAGNQGVSNPNQNQLFTLCAANGHNYVYRGNLEAINNGGNMAVNAVLLEDYLLGVTPSESPASWGSSGGEEALKAQAVAARSYALSSPASGYTTCDSTACQVYLGVSHDGVTTETANTDTAVTSTAGQVRHLNSAAAGVVARTEFSSSTGGYTAGGTFPAVVDDGDAVSGNSHHSWTASIPVTTIQNAYPSIGSLQAINVTSRNGLGDFGGRVNSLTLVGSNGSTSVSGDSFRGAVGLQSDWFGIQYQASGGIGGYWTMASDGGIFSFGNATFYGSMGGKPLNAPVIGLSPTADTRGYWLVASDGGIFAYGDAPFYGSMGGQHLNRPMVSMTPTPSGHGYWMVASDGGVFAYGDAGFYGSMGGQHLNAPVVGIASTPSGHGYWLVASDGGIFAYGDAAFLGSTGGQHLDRPVVGMAATSSGAGYWLVGADGGIFAYGNAPYEGSMPADRVNATATGISPTATGAGYMIVTTNGAVHSYGDAPYFGDMAGQRFNGSMMAIGRVFG